MGIFVCFLNSNFDTVNQAAMLILMIWELKAVCFFNLSKFEFNILLNVPQSFPCLRSEQTQKKNDIDNLTPKGQRMYAHK